MLCGVNWIQERGFRARLKANKGAMQTWVDVAWSPPERAAGGLQLKHSHKDRQGQAPSGYSSPCRCTTWARDERFVQDTMMVDVGGWYTLSGLIP